MAAAENDANNDDPGRRGALALKATLAMLEERQNNVDIRNQRLCTELDAERSCAALLQSQAALDAEIGEWGSRGSGGMAKAIVNQVKTAKINFALIISRYIKRLIKGDTLIE